MKRVVLGYTNFGHQKPASAIAIGTCEQPPQLLPMLYHLQESQSLPPH